MKICPNCHEEIPESAKKCPSCGARLAGRPIYKKWWFWIALIVLAIIAIAALGGDSEDTPPAITNPGDELVETISPAPEASPSPSPEETPAERTITAAGQSVTTKNFVLTLEAVNKSQGNDFFKPDSGKEFLELVLVLENASDKETTVTTAMFDAYLDGFAISESISGTAASDLPAMSGTLAAGKKLRGALIYEVPTGWKELEIQADLALFSLTDADKVTILLNNP